MQRKEELLSRINEVKTILDKMKKRGRCFSFNPPVKFGKIRVDEIVLQLMEDCALFVEDMHKLREAGKKLTVSTLNSYMKDYFNWIGCKSSEKERYIQQNCSSAYCLPSRCLLRASRCVASGAFLCAILEP